MILKCCGVVDPKNWTTKKVGIRLKNRGPKHGQTKEIHTGIQSTGWKKEFIERSPMLFENGTNNDARDEQIAELERMVGRLATELEMRKKVTNFLDSK